MSEFLDVYDLKGKFLRTEERDKYYREIMKEFRERGKITTQVKRVLILLMNSAGRIYLQKRSTLKKENSGMYDKTVGGHVKAGNTWNTSMIEECAQELGFPASVLSNKEFESAVNSIDLSIIGIFEKIDEKTRNSVRIKQNGDRFIMPYIEAVFIGYFDGAIRFVDGESSGIETFLLEELKKEIKNKPEKFTDDLKNMVENYEKYLKPLK